MVVIEEECVWLKRSGCDRRGRWVWPNRVQIVEGTEQATEADIGGRTGSDGKDRGGIACVQRAEMDDARGAAHRSRADTFLPDHKQAEGRNVLVLRRKV